MTYDMESEKKMYRPSYWNIDPQFVLSKSTNRLQRLADVANDTTELVFLFGTGKENN